MSVHTLFKLECFIKCILIMFVFFFFLMQCLKREEWSFVGEILLGLKYSQSGASESLREKPDITVDCGVMGGQLQVGLHSADVFVVQTVYNVQYTVMK